MTSTRRYAPRSHAILSHTLQELIEQLQYVLFFFPKYSVLLWLYLQKRMMKQSHINVSVRQPSQYDLKRATTFVTEVPILPSEPLSIKQTISRNTPLPTNPKKANPAILEF